ncbi:UNVERIFIED_CONTAM: putative mitochondrial protein [Sesamum latifolium]|uniref:Mitochondrial protein n=1 Tax=Sesamum latifolium TaxID=2727402 RepID=A0AAW2Y0B1_9LAMI
MWKQRGKAQWLQEGDRNTPFFYARASAQKRKNSIIRIRTPSGSWCHSREGIQQIISTYFHELFRSSNPSEESIAEVLRGMNARVSEDMNEALIQPFTLEEVKRAISQMYPYKSPGPDGMPLRGLRQGDPLSPYLFLFCAEALSHLLVKAESRGELTGVAVSRHGPRISHLLFANDTLIFCQATEEAMICLRRVLKEFEAASVLVVNLEKSAIAFSRNTPEHLQAYLAGLLGFVWCTNMTST